MDRPKVIVVATDFAEPSEAALATAIDYAKVFDAQIVLMHAFQVPIVGFPDGAVMDIAELTSRLMEGAKEGLDRQAEVHDGSGVPIRCVVKQGDAWRMVNETVDECGAGLVVIGTHGRRGLSRALLGSVAEKVVRSATVPVLTVHPENGAHARTSAPWMHAPRHH
jgi:nucleotide-binding universal stress UspA family protein